jgi:hypothetical protein
MRVVTAVVAPHHSYSPNLLHSPSAVAAVTAGSHCTISCHVVRTDTTNRCNNIHSVDQSVAASFLPPQVIAKSTSDAIAPAVIDALSGKIVHRLHG